MIDMARLTADLDRAQATKVDARIAAATRWVALEALRRVVMKSPVDTGRLRGNWQVAFGVRPDGVLEVTDAAGAGTISQGLQALADLQPGTVVYIANNLPYARRIEEGWSQQAPQGMVAVTVAELEAFFADIPAEQSIPETGA